MFNPLKPAFAYVRESKEELEKVTWPTRRQTARYAVIVIAVSVAVGAFFAALDWALNLGLGKLIEMTS